MDFGDILIWDAHFGPNEGRVSLEAIENDKHLQKIKSFLPLQKITVLGGYDYSIHIFEKVKNRSSKTNSTVFSRRLRFSPGTSDRIKIADGDTALEVMPGDLYSPNIVIYAEELNPKEIHEADVEIQFKGNDVITEKDVLLVFSIENGKEVLHYNTQPLTWKSDENEWKTVTLNSRFPGNIPDSAVIKIYIWNRNRKSLLIKKLESKITSY